MKEQIINPGYYWIRHSAEKINRVCYIGTDHDGNQWVFNYGGSETNLMITSQFLKYHSYEAVQPPTTLG